MSVATKTDVTAQREAIIAMACGKLAAELRLIDPFRFAAFFNLGQMPSVYDEINQIVWRNFREGALSFTCTGDTLICWSKHPAVALDFEFSHGGVLAFFRLILVGRQPAVELHHVAFEQANADNGQGSLDENSIRLSQAMEAAARYA